MRRTGRHRTKPRGGPMRSRAGPMLAFANALPFMLADAPASAQSCTAEIERLARQYDLGPGTPRSGSTEAPAPPAGHEPGAPTSERLGRTGGVVTPPDIDAPMSVHPPAGHAA